MAMTSGALRVRAASPPLPLLLRRSLEALQTLRSPHSLPRHPRIGIGERKSGKSSCVQLSLNSTRGLEGRIRIGSPLTSSPLASFFRLCVAFHLSSPFLAPNSIFSSFGFPSDTGMRNLRLLPSRTKSRIESDVEGNIDAKAEAIPKKPSRKRKATPDPNQKSEAEIGDAPSQELDVSIQDKDESKSKSNSKSKKANPNPQLKKQRNVKNQIQKEDQNAAENAEDQSEHEVKPWLKNSHKTPQPEWYAYDPLTMRKKEDSFANSHGKTVKPFKVISWNVNGLRALLKRDKEKNGLDELSDLENPDVICLQETKLQNKDVDALKDDFLPQYKKFWSCSTSKLGYSGCALFSKEEPISVKYAIDQFVDNGEGRIIIAEFQSFFVVNTYVPNSGDKLERLPYREMEWDPALSKFLKQLEREKPVILTGDLNCAHQEIDIHNPNGNKRSAGFTDEERNSFTKRFMEVGFVDTFRRLHPHAIAFTYWGYRFNSRAKNAGWRLDYFLVSDGLFDQVFDSFTMPGIGGSDHCPLGLTLQVS